MENVKEKTVFLWSNSNDYMPNEMKYRDIKTIDINKKTSKTINFIRRIFFKLNLPFQSIWYNKEWKEQIKILDTVIMGDLEANNSVIKYIKKNNPNVRVIIWYWNTIIDNGKKSRELIDHDCEVWSFDQEDCKKYNLQYNTQFYSKYLVTKRTSYMNDIIFIGMDKGRMSLIMKLENHFKSLNLKTNFHIIRSKESIGDNEKFRQRIPYKEVSKIISESKCILDLTIENQNGLTLRPLEALFFSKKLITNNKNIIHYDFYNKNNIFIIGMDDNSNLLDFIKSDYHTIDSKTIQYYDIEAWFKRFFEKKTILL